MFNNIRNEYSVKIIPSDNPEGLELLLNTMSEDGWELYTLHETESPRGGMQYNCIFVREIEEETLSDANEIVDVTDFKSRMEKMLDHSGEPY